MLFFLSLICKIDKQYVRHQHVQNYYIVISMAETATAKQDMSSPDMNLDEFVIVIFIKRGGNFGNMIF